MIDYDIKTWLIDELYTNPYLFNFKLTYVSFDYQNQDFLSFNAKANDFKTEIKGSKFETVVKEKLRYLIKSRTGENFSFEYNYSLLHEDILKTTVILKDFFNKFLYEFEFIDSARFWDSNRQPFFISINGSRHFGTHFKKDSSLSNIKNFKTFLMEKKY